jgi:hypothetical protein
VAIRGHQRDISEIAPALAAGAPPPPHPDEIARAAPPPSCAPPPPRSAATVNVNEIRSHIHTQGVIHTQGFIRGALRGAIRGNQEAINDTHLHGVTIEFNQEAIKRPVTRLTCTE